MKKILIASLLVLSASANAEFVEKDWKLPGDKLVTLDTVTNLEWLDLSVTDTDQQKDEIYNVYRRTQEYVEPGYEWLENDFIGWRIATKEEVDILLHHAFPNLPVPFDTHNIDSTSIEYTQKSEFGQLFGGTFYSAPYSHIAQYVKGGYCDAEVVSAYSMPACWLGGVFGNSIQGTENESQASTYRQPTWLVRGEAIDVDPTCPAVTTEMTRQQALEYIEHLSTQLVDPTATVITSLNF